MRYSHDAGLDMHPLWKSREGYLHHATTTKEIQITKLNNPTLTTYISLLSLPQFLVRPCHFVTDSIGRQFIYKINRCQNDIIFLYIFTWSHWFARVSCRLSCYLLSRSHIQEQVFQWVWDLKRSMSSSRWLESLWYKEDERMLWFFNLYLPETSTTEHSFMA